MKCKMSRGPDGWTKFCRILNFALVFETVLAFALIYVPGINSGLQMEMLFPTAWFPCLPFVILGRGSMIQLMSLKETKSDFVVVSTPKLGGRS